MNTAFVATGQATVAPIGPRSLLRRMSRRTGMALMAWSEAGRQRRTASRAELAELHERRVAAEQLREERFRTVAVGRLV